MKSLPSLSFAILAALALLARPVAAAPGQPRVSFANEVVPTFTKLGCNAGGCHGKASGQNGFKLSLFGFDSTFDFVALTREARGRRIFFSSPDESLLLRKATGRAAHGGGKKLDPDGWEYQVMRRWIAAGAP